MSAGGPTDPASGPVELLGGGETSLLEAVDSLLNRGVLLQGDLVLGLADVDLVYLELRTLLAAADRILGRGRVPPPPASGGDPPRDPTPRDRETTAKGGEEELASSRAEAAPEPAGADDETAPVDSLRGELERSLGARSAPPRSEAPAAHGSEEHRPARWNAEPEDVERSVARLVLALVEFLRKLMERQAVRRMEEGTLTEEQVERLGQALMRLEETVHEMARRFGLRPEDLNLDLGPLGRLT